MLSTIDQTKVHELLHEKKPQFFVVASQLIAGAPPKLVIPPVRTYGAYFTPPKSLVEVEEYISSLRAKVLASGITLKSADEIDRELDQMRRRDLV